MSRLSKLGRPRKIPLRLVLVIPFVVEVFAAVGLTGYLSFKNGQRAVDDLATRFRGEISNRIDQHLQDYFETPQIINQLNAEAIQLEELSPQDPQALGFQFWRQLRVFDEVQYIYFGSASGGFIGGGRDTEHGLTIEATRDYAPGDFEIYATDGQGNRQSLIDVTPDYDPRRRDWYIQAQQTGEPGWSEIYSIFPQAELALSITQPVYDDEQNFQGVLAVDLVLAGIDHFLSELEILDNGQTFIVERTGNLVATSNDETPFVTAEGADEPERLNIDDSKNPLIQAAAQELKRQFDDLQFIEKRAQFQFELAGELQYGQIMPVSQPEGPDWLIVVIVPESDFMAQINANTRNTILLCLGALGVATLLGIATTRWITRPILKLSQASQEIARTAKDDTDQSPFLMNWVDGQGIAELEALADSFNQMSAQLKTSFAALEETNVTLETRVEQRTRELSEALNDLKATQLQLIQQEKLSSLGQMVAGVAHEINNPISFIYGNIMYAHKYTQDLLLLIETYQQEYPNPNQRVQQTAEDIELEFLREDLPKILDSMKLGAERIREIVLSLRNFSRVDQTAQKIVDIHEGLESTLHILQHRLKANGARPEIKVIKSYGALPSINCYPGQLNQVFMNILSNAIDALEEKIEQPQDKLQQATKGGSENSAIDCTIVDGSTAQNLPVIHPYIEIQTASTTEAITIQISDNGPGISAHIAERIFDPFFTTKSAGKGTGLGLLLSYQIVVENHGGTLAHQPTPEGGAVFEITIPIVLD